MSVTSPPLTFYLFGPLRALVRGEPLPRVRTRSVEWLLALLVLRHDRAVSRSWLAGTLWPESEESRALQNLRDDLMRLRKALGPESGRIQSPARDTLTLDLTGAEVDVVRFDSAVRAGDEEALRSAVEVYTGPLLEGCYEEWALAERDTRAAQCLTALETLADRAEERGDHEEAVRLLRWAEALDPLRDSTARRLMASLAAAGDPAAAIEVYRGFRNRLHEELATAPDEATSNLFHEIRARARQTAKRKDEGDKQNLHPSSFIPHPSARPPARPPIPLTRLIGREREVEAVRERLAQSRLVTLVGAGGVGKTRLAMEVAALVEEDLDGGAAWVEFAPLADGALLLPAIGAALGIREEHGANREDLSSRIAARLAEGRSLLALDNCEHVLDAAAAVVEALLQVSPGLRVLATSRQRLGLPGEVAWRVPSLPVPDLSHLPVDEEGTVECALAFPAVRLFVERAESARPGFRLADHDDAAAIGTICRRLDGIPLAIELAAARVAALTPGQIAARLDDRFALLTTGARTALPRQKTLRAMIDWSYDLLTEDERALLARLAVFADGWTLEAAERICAVDGSWLMVDGQDERPSTINHQPSTHEVLNLLTSLTDKSLVVVEEQEAGLRYRMLETIREYSGEKLAERGESAPIRSRHAAYFLALAEEVRPKLGGPEQAAWLNCLEREHDNLRVALQWYQADEGGTEMGMRLAAAMRYLWEVHAHGHERRTWLEGLASRPSPRTEARARVLNGAGNLALDSGDHDLAQRRFEESLAIMRELGNRPGVAETLINLGLVARARYDRAGARSLYEESLAIMRELGDRQGIAHNLFDLGELACHLGEMEEARRLWEECRTLDRALGVKGGYVLRGLARLARERGDYGEAHRHLSLFLIERREIGNLGGVCEGLAEFARLATAQGQAGRAARLCGASTRLRAAVGGSLTTGERPLYDAMRNSLREALGEGAFAAALTEGRALTLEQAIEYALEDSPP